jgi:Holliday junction resolvase RusA-like endonuclease
MKSRKQKLMDYEEQFNGIPRDYNERLSWMYDKYNITEAKAEQILRKREEMLRYLYYTSLHIVLYEIPEGSPRPRTRLINRSNLINSAISNPNFIHIYSPTGAEDNKYMKRLVTEQDFINIEQLICTPCDVVYSTFSKTPSSYSKEDIFLAEIGLERPVAKPDWDNIGKKYSDMSNHNIWLDDILTIDGKVSKYYSILPRIEIDLLYLNCVYNKYQYDMITKRKDFMPEMQLDYFGRRM